MEIVVLVGTLDKWRSHVRCIPAVPVFNKLAGELLAQACPGLHRKTQVSKDKQKQSSMEK